MCTHAPFTDHVQQYCSSSKVLKYICVPSNSESHVVAMVIKCISISEACCVFFPFFCRIRSTPGMGMSDVFFYVLIKYSLFIFIFLGLFFKIYMSNTFKFLFSLCHCKFLYNSMSILELVAVEYITFINGFN